MKRELVWHVTLWSNAKSTFDSDDGNGDDVDVVRASVWFEFFGGLVLCRNP